MRHEITQADRAISKLNSQLEKLNLRLDAANSANEVNQLLEINAKIESVKAELEKSEEAWLILQEELAAL